MIKLSIMIATIPERRVDYMALRAEFNRQVGQGYSSQVEILVNDAPRGTLSVGTKSQIMLGDATGDYVVRFDDDDWPRAYYLEEIMKALVPNPDCVGFKIQMTTDGKNDETCIHSLANPTWEKRNGIYLRPVTHFNPVKRSIAMQVGFPDKAWGEDRDYSDGGESKNYKAGVTALCKHEVYIDKYLFHYRYKTNTPHKVKYGIK